MTHLQSNVY